MNIRHISSKLMMAAAVVTILNFNSCKKYEDGPGFSLRSKKGRLVGEWEVVRVFDETGSDLLSNSEYDFSFDFNKNGDFIETFGYSYPDGTTYSYTYKGEWSFSSNKEKLILTQDGETLLFKIKRLTNKEVWMVSDADKYEWQLEAK